MESIAKSALTEDRYIAYLAGIQEGQNPIGFLDKYKAYYAQKHPISNTIMATALSYFKSAATVTLGLMAYPIINSSMRSTISGGWQDVCLACGKHIASGVDVILKVQRHLVDPNKAQTRLEQLINSWVQGLKSGGSCAINERQLTNCRAINYAGNIWQTLSDNYVLIGAATVGLAALFSYFNARAYAEQECQTEEELKNALKDRFAKIATRLTALEDDPEVQKCAKNILIRKLEINKDIESLKLPSLAWRDIEEITQPVMDAAIKVRSKMDQFRTAF